METQLGISILKDLILKSFQPDTEKGATIPT